MVVSENNKGGYSFVPSNLGFASAVVRALPGMAIEWAVLPKAVSISDGFDAARRHLELLGRPLEALCGIDLKLPYALARANFSAFNREYIARLDAWGLRTAEGCPLARTNVSPSINPPVEPSVLSFSYTVPTDEGTGTFVVSGVGELPDDTVIPDGVVRHRETSHAALLEKAACVVEVVDHRLRAIGVDWDSSMTVQLYSAHDVTSSVQGLLAQKGLAPTHGLIWHDAAPPVDDLELEIDVRAYRRQLRLPLG
ncbi:2-amino-5-chloromuconate deaminase CnbZ [Nocardia sp. NPDC004750]